MKTTLLSVGTNEKLGKKTSSYSRPVGPTCPSTCPFLGAGCYAESIQKRYITVRAKWAAGVVDNTEWDHWITAYARALESNGRRGVLTHRIHVGGDWLLDGALDIAYLRATERALAMARYLGWTGKAFYYTHVWRFEGMVAWREALKAVGAQGYASVHSEAEALEAAAAGWLVAIDPGESLKAKKAVVPKSGFREIMGVRSLNCPEQVKGSAQVTCDACQYCVKGLGHVTFYRH